MTKLENFQRLCRNQGPQWIPFTLGVGAGDGFTQPIQERFARETGARDPAEFFDYDFRTASVARRPAVADPQRFFPDTPAGTTFDEWGIGHWAGGAAGSYEQMFHPLAAADSVAEVESFPVPLLDTTGLADQVRAFHDRGYPVMGYAGSIYEWSWWLRGMQEFMMDLVAEPDRARAIIAKVGGFTRNLALATAAAGVDVLCFYDDAGMQTGLQVSPAVWRTFIKPAWQDVIGAVRARYPQAILFLHSCGNIAEIVPDIVELGIQILHPLQPECMDGAAVKRRFGDRLIPCATIGAQHLFSFGTPQEIRQEVRRLAATLGRDKRCLFCSSNAIQPETPWENILAFVAAVRELRE